MMDDNIRFESGNLEFIKTEIKKGGTTMPCNIWKYIVDLEERITKLEEVK